MRALVYPEIRSPERLLVAGPVKNLTVEEAAALEFRPASVGMALGPPWSTFWFQIESSVPESWGGERVDLLFETGSESTVWLDGRPVQGLNTSGECPRPDAVLVSRADSGSGLEVLVETACSGAFGQLDAPEDGPRLRRCELGRFDAEAWRLWLDYATLVDLEAELTREGLEPTWSGFLLEALNTVCNLWNAHDRSTWTAASRALEELYRCRNGSVAHEVFAIGHAHIDTAWLWPLSETYRKCVRTFSTQINLMDRYPSYLFACSQAQQYLWIKERQPDLYQLIKERVARGQWLPVGGSWIEPDCNLPSGEALVRQYLFGQRFFEGEFGRRCRESWLPDTFGFNGQLPQIMRGAGIGRFLTQKLSWNRFTQQPHHTFVWQGIDGSEVVAHFPPVDDYNAEATVHELCASVRNFKDHSRSRESIVPFGHGDGGGGPTARMIETLERVRDLQAVPRTQIATVDAFFERVEARRDDLPRVLGELYFETHQGTYTSQAQTKRANRGCEQLLHDTEFLWSVTDRLGLASYPADELAEAWRLQLLNAFHDILPGSSITAVYEDSARDFARIAETCERLCDVALDALSSNDGAPSPVNTISFERQEVVQHPGGDSVLVSCPALGIGEIADAEEPVRLETSGRELVLENGQLRVGLSPAGDVLSVIEKSTGYEALAGPGNVLELYDDRPTEEEAWNVDPFHLETRRSCPGAESFEVISDGPLRAEVAFERSVGNESSLRQTIRLDAHSRRLEFHTTVDWREEHVFLKVAFPTVIRASNASYETQFGAIERPTHSSTAHDLARYEVPGHRFVDLSEMSFGVALLTDCKYGYSVSGSTMRISLLRAPKEPDPDADIGTHEFSYALVPHGGRWPEAGIVAEAASFNAPMRWTPRTATRRSFATVDGGLVLDTMKRAEDDAGLVLRLYEPSGGRGTARLTLGLPAEIATPSNLLEDRIGDPTSLRDGILELSYRPFEILTLRIE
jgi:alpha-mannosidase